MSFLCKKIQQAILDAEPQAKHKNIKVEHNYKLLDRFGCEKQFDLKLGICIQRIFDDYYFPPFNFS